MQTVSRDILRKLISATTESENDTKLMFSECVSKYLSFLEEFDEYANKKRTGMSTVKSSKFSDRFAYAYDKLLSSHLKRHKKDFKFVGVGSSRAVFAMPGGKCLKIAYSKRGAAQNEQEIDNSQSSYECFPMTYGVDYESFGVILVECCAPMYISSTMNDFSLAYGNGVRLKDVIATLSDIVNMCNCDIDHAHKKLTWSVDNGQYFNGNENDEYCTSYETRLSLCSKIRSDKSPQFEVLRNIIKFYSDHGRNDSSMLLIDLEYDKNWGLAIRENKMVPIIIDSGFSEYIADNYY